MRDPEGAALAALSNGYDRNGDLTNDGARAFSYDFDNRLSGVTIAASSTVVTLAYDPASRLSQQQTTVGAAAAVTTRYLYDGQRPVRPCGSGRGSRRSVDRRLAG